MSVDAGEILGLIGANGAGKSTLMNVLAGVIRADEGTVLLDGRDVSSASPRQAIKAGIARVPQEISLVDNHSIAENMMFERLPSRFGLVRRERLNAVAAELLTRVGLPPNIDPQTHAGRLTPVQQRLVTIAQALAKDPRVVILDEPSAALPTETAEVLGTITRSLAASGVAVIYVSHRLEEIRDLCDRVMAMRDGKVAGTLRGNEIDIPTMVRLVGGADIETRHPTSPDNDAISTRPIVVEARGLCGMRVTDVDLDIRAHEILGVGGLYGAGRSELLRLIGGSQRPTSGTVSVFGAPGPTSSHQASKRAIGYVAEGRASMILRGMSVKANASIAHLGSFSTARTLVKRASERTAVIDLSQRVGLVGDLEAEISTLSGGNQQKIFLARWLIGGCKLLLLDEPTVGIDVHARAEIHRLLMDLADQGTTIVVASAEPEELVTICDRVVVLVEGRVSRELRRPFEAQSVISASYAGQARGDSG